jgi:hypothetical protein
VALKNMVPVKLRKKLQVVDKPQHQHIEMLKLDQNWLRKCHQHSKKGTFVEEQSFRRVFEIKARFQGSWKERVKRKWRFWYGKCVFFFLNQRWC